MELLEHIMRSFNGYAQGLMMMWEVKEEVNQQATEEGIDMPLYLNIIHTAKWDWF